jgi:transcriptional regulator with XRE-family HTH domain
MTDWRQRLTDAVDRTGRRTVAKEAGISLATLNHILRDEESKQTFETIVSIAHAARKNVGWLLGEGQYPVTEEERQRMRSIINFLDDHFPQLDRDRP